MRRYFLSALLLAVAIMSACSVLTPSASTQNAPLQDSGPTPTPYDPTVSEHVANAFLKAWERGDYPVMYEQLSPNSTAEFTLEDFTRIYTDAEAAMTMVSLTATPQSVLPEETGRTAQLAFKVTYNTRLLGAIEENLTMRLTFDEETQRWGIFWTPALIFPELAAGNTLQLQVEKPQRANIYDKDGQWMVAANASAVTLQIVPGEVSPDFEQDMLVLLSRMLRLTPDEIYNQYNGLPSDWTVALGDIDMETFNEYRSAFYSYPGLSAFEKTGRRYFDVLAPHVIGYTGFVPDTACAAYQEQGYQCDEIVGLAGLEAWGEEYLSGVRGAVLSAYTPSGQYFGEVARRNAEPAQSLYLTIDRELQAAVQNAVEDAFRYSQDTWASQAGGAAVVVMDAKTGKVLAMASYPLFDPNVFNPNNSHPNVALINEWLNSPLRPLINRATQGQYPAGSVFKIVSATAALDSGLFNTDWTYNSTGTWAEAGTQFIKYDWQPSGHGTINLAQAITVSCNSCFYHVGYVTAQQDYDLIPSYARLYGFGSELGLQIPEASGQVPDVTKMTSDGNPWGVLDSVNLAIGQGDLLVTPIQIAVMTAAVANGGTVYRPQFVDRIGLIGEEPSMVFGPEVIRSLEVDPEILAYIREGMYDVARDPVRGTATYRLGSISMDVAGKTGTAQASQGQPIAWFTGFAPYDDPEIVVTVMVENGGQGSTVASPIFRRVIEAYYGLRVAPWPNDWGDPEQYEFVSESIGE